MYLAATSRLPNPLSLEGGIYENWMKFKREFQDYIMSIEFNQKPDEVKAAKLRNLIGDEGRQLIFRLHLENTSDFSDLVRKLEEWAELQRNPTYERLKFYHLIQNESESFESFLKTAENLVVRCNFGDLTEELLRDKIITGILNCDLKEIFRRTPEITRETAVQMCRLADLSEEQLQGLLHLKKLDSKDGRDDSIITSAVHPAMKSFVKSSEVKELGGKVSNRNNDEFNNQSLSASCDPFEGTLNFTIGKISEFQDVWFSPITYMSGLPWKFKAKQYDSKTDGSSEKYFGIFLECGGIPSKSWSCLAKVMFKIISHKSEVKPPTKRFLQRRLYQPGSLSWGFHQFIPWNNLLNPENGFIKDDSVPFEVYIKLEPPSITSFGPLKKNSSKKTVSVRVILEDAFLCHQGNGLFDPEQTESNIFIVEEDETLLNFVDRISKYFGRTFQQIRPWSLSYRSYGTLRPQKIDMTVDLQKPVSEVSKKNPWNIFLEVVPPESNLNLPPFDEEEDVLLFFKLYDPKLAKIIYLGHSYVPRSSTTCDVIPILNERAGFSSDTKVLVYEEILGETSLIANLDAPLQKSLKNMSDGDILIFQKKKVDTALEYKTPQDYFIMFASKAKRTDRKKIRR